MPVQTPVPIRLPGSFPPNVPQPFGYNSSPLSPPADYYVSRKELLEIAPDLGVMKSVPSAANDTVVLFDDKGQVKSSGVKLSDKVDVVEGKGLSTNDYTNEDKAKLAGIDLSKYALQTSVEMVATTAVSAQQAADTAQQAADTAQQAADTAQQAADTALTAAQTANSGVSDLSTRCDDIYMEASGASTLATMANDAAITAMETANAAYSPTNPPPAPDLAGKADKVANAITGNLATLDENGNLTDSGMALRDFAVAESLAPVFVAGAAYEVGDLCTSFDNDEQHKGAWLYKCILATDGSQPTWPETDPTHWALATVDDILAALRTALAGKQDALSQEQVNAVNSGITADKVSKLEGIEAGAQKNPDLSGYATKVYVDEKVGNIETLLNNINSGDGV